MKTCKTGCGGKMKAGGTKKNYQDGGPTFEDLDKKNRREFFKGKSAKAGILTSLTGIGAGVGKMVADAGKKRKAVSAIKKSNPGMTRKEARKKLNEPTEEKQLGGAKKKYQKGGGIQQIVGMPGYNARTDTMKKGGSAKKFAALAPPYDKATYADKIVGAKKKAKFGASVPVQHSPAPGRVRSSSGMGTVPVGTRKQKGGSIKRK
jgi:hypothetical protein